MNDTNKPSCIKDNGCEVYRDDNAKTRLMEWGYPRMGGSRYAFDQGLKGWEQFDTPQDASYYGIWTSVDRLAIVHYTEGDVCLVIAPTSDSFKSEVRDLWDWNHNYDPKSGVHTQLDSPKLQKFLAGHPPFDAVMSTYSANKSLESAYLELHERAYTIIKKSDPSSDTEFRVHYTANHVLFLRKRPGDHKIICACLKDRNGDYDLNKPTHVMGSYCGDPDVIPDRIQILRDFLSQEIERD